MRKPKYYLKPFYKVKPHWGISKRSWESARKQNNRPIKTDYDYEIPYIEGPRKGTWSVQFRALTQRLFIEQKEEAKKNA